MSRVPITILISGTGTNLGALIAAQSESSYQIVKVISNRKAAGGLILADEANIPRTVHNLLKYNKLYGESHGETKARHMYDEDLAKLIMEDKPRLVVCAGFMHVLSEHFVETLNHAGVDIINLHPAKWGAFDGRNAIQRSHEAFMKGDIDETGVMIHHVIAQVDRGAVVIQQNIPLTHPEDDDIHDLESRIHETEHQLIVKGTELAVQAIKCKNN